MSQGWGGNRQFPPGWNKVIRPSVIARDGGQCTARNDEGIRCSETTNLEVDHIKPWSQGGGDTPDNLRTLCHWHHEQETAKARGQAIKARNADRERRGIGRRHPEERHPGILP